MSQGLQLEGKVTLVTGASRGMGLAICQRFVEQGAQLVMASRSKPNLEHPNALWLPVDLTDPAAIESLFDRCIAQFGRLDLLVNNAGLQLAKTVDESSDEDFDALASLNMRAPFQCCRRAVQHMRQQGSGNIINIGSIGGDTADHGLALYNASKAWIHGLTRAIATDHGRHGIRCNAISPSWTMTEMSTEFFDAEPDPAAAQAGVARRHPLGRLAEPEDIADACLWLASEGSRYINGQQIRVDGGMSASSAVDPELDIMSR